MNAGGPLLRDIHLPSAAWWPLAPGWWIVVALVLLVACVVTWLLWRRTRQRPLRAALREIDAIEAAHARGGDIGQLADGVSRLLRRVAYKIDPAAASQFGDAWRLFLSRYARDEVTHEALSRLVEARYQAHPVLDAPALLAALRAWCREALRGRGVRHASAHRKGTPGTVEEASPL